MEGDQKAPPLSTRGIGETHDGRISEHIKEI